MLRFQPNFISRALIRITETFRYHAMLALPLLTLNTAFAEWRSPGELIYVEPSPYILYWGGIEAHFDYTQTTDTYAAELKLSPEAILEALKREPRLWDGKTLLETLSLEIRGIAVQSDYNRPEIYQACLPQLKEALSGLKEGELVAIEKIPFPDGKTGTVLLTAGPSEFKENQETAAILPNLISWGKYLFLKSEKRFMTTAEFWDMLLFDPQVHYPNQTTHSPQQWNISLFHENMPIMRLLSNWNEALDLNQIRERLDQEHESITAGAIINFSAWDIVQESPNIRFDTFFTLDPVTLQETATIVQRGSPGAFRFPADALLSIVVVEDDDPRRFLRFPDLQDFTLNWGPFSERISGKQFAQSYTTVSGDSIRHVYADRKLKMWNNKYPKKDILAMLDNPLQLFQGTTELKDFSLIIHYKNRDFYVQNGQTPKELTDILRKEVKAGDLITISGIHASVRPYRYLTGLKTVLEQYPELKSKIQSAEVAEVYLPGEKQSLLRLRLPVEEFEVLRLKLEKKAGIWLQHGDIDLNPFTFEVEVRDEDPKPELPENEKH